MYFNLKNILMISKFNIKRILMISKFNLERILMISNFNINKNLDDFQYMNDADETSQYELVLWDLAVRISTVRTSHYELVLWESRTTN